VALTVGQPIPDLSVQAYLRGRDTPVVFKLSSHRGSWVILFFYPGDFTLICPTELAALASRYDDILAEEGVLLAASTNSTFSHKAWLETDPRVANVNFPVIADTLRDLSRAFGVLLEDGTAQRATFIIDPDGVLMHMSVTAHDVGRSVDELVRVLRAFRTGALCPANWAPGDLPLSGKDDWLAKVFPGLVGPELAQLEQQAERVSFAAGDTIVAEGDPADRFYVISQGEVTISQRGPNGDETKLATLGRGQFFGEVGILADMRRTATVRAVGDVELLGLSWERFQETLERSDRAERDFAAIVRERVAFAP
jgi:alkyl hydroperoxide reductase subunit AhpC